jgi:hypothetical protein
MECLVLSLEVVHHPVLAGEGPPVEGPPWEAVNPEVLASVAFSGRAPAPAIVSAER